MKYRVYQNMTEFAIDVEAENESEAIKIATSTANMGNWDRYEPTEDNITYEAVCQESTDEENAEIKRQISNAKWGKEALQELPKVEGAIDGLPDNAELLEMGLELNRMLCFLIEKLDPKTYYQSDLIMFADDWDKIVNGELSLESLSEHLKNVRKFIETNKK